MREPLRNRWGSLTSLWDLQHQLERFGLGWFWFSVFLPVFFPVHIRFLSPPRTPFVHYLQVPARRDRRWLLREHSRVVCKEVQTQTKLSEALKHDRLPRYIATFDWDCLALEGAFPSYSASFRYSPRSCSPFYQSGTLLVSYKSFVSILYYLIPTN